MGYSLDILASIRNNASEDYAARIPEATQENIAAIGQAFMTYEPLYNEFCAALINKIGRTIINQKMAKNRLARFKAGSVSPHDVEEIFIEMAKAEGSYDKTGPNPLGRRTPPDVKVIYHRENRQDYYAISLGDIDFLRVFRSESTLDTFIKGMINSVYSADVHDEWLAMKNVLATYVKPGTSEIGYFDYEVPKLTEADFTGKATGAMKFSAALRKAVNDMAFMSDKFNAAGVMTFSEPSEMVLLLNKDVAAHIDVALLSQAFNPSHADIKVTPNIVIMDDFGTLTDTYALLVDKDWFRIYDTLQKMEPQRNAQGLFTNYFYHHHQILSASTFKNAVRFKAVAA